MANKPKAQINVIDTGEKEGPLAIGQVNNFVGTKGEAVAPVRKPIITGTIVAVQTVSPKYTKMPFGACIARKLPCWLAKPALIGKRSSGQQDVGTLDEIGSSLMPMYPGMMIGIANKKKKIKGLLLYVDITGPDTATALIMSPETWTPKYEWMNFPWHMDTQIGSQIIPPLQELGQRCERVHLVGCRIDHFKNEDLDSVQWAQGEIAVWTGINSDRLNQIGKKQQPQPMGQPAQSRVHTMETQTVQNTPQTTSQAPATGMAQLSENMANELKSEDNYVTSLAEHWINSPIDGSRMDKAEIMKLLGRILIDARLPEVRDKLMDKIKEQI